MDKEWINARTMHRIRKDSPKQIEQDHQRAHECSSFKGTRRHIRRRRGGAGTGAVGGGAADDGTPLVKHVLKFKFTQMRRRQIC
jgi:hypothetical protein